MLLERMEKMNRLRELRVKKGLLQSDIAKVINKTDRAVGQYEREERDPSSETWIKLAEFFDVSLDYLLGKTKSKKNENKIDDVINEEMIGMSKEEYNKLPSEQKKQIRDFALFVKNQYEKNKNK